MKPRTLLRLMLLGPLCFGSSLLGQTTFSNSALIMINDGATATPYPSTINVSGLSGTITDVNVTLTNINHNFPDDIGLLL